MSTVEEEGGTMARTAELKAIRKSENAKWLGIWRSLKAHFGARICLTDYKYEGQNPDTLIAFAVRVDDDDQALIASVCWNGQYGDL